jgi:hypothetical protein
VVPATLRRLPPGATISAVDPSDQGRSQFGALPIVVGVFAVIAIVVTGVGLGPIAALVVAGGFALVAIVAVFVLSSSGSRIVRGDAPEVRLRDDGHYRILLVTTETCAAPEAVADLRARGGGAEPTIFVMARAHESGVGLTTGDEDGYDLATAVLRKTLEGLRAAGLHAQGEVAASNPLQAADDGLRQFPANEIVFASGPAGGGTRAIGDVLKRARKRYQQPVDLIPIG